MSDQAGRARSPRPSLVSGVLFNWMGYFVTAASGFVIPRLMSDRVGQETLGLWDFGWSLAAYATLLGMGVTSATSRYVARYRDLNEPDSLNRLVSTAAMLLGGCFVLACAVVALLAYFTPSLIQVDDPAQVALARWLVIILGFNGAVQLPTQLFDGFLTGYQRFDLKNLHRGVCQLVGAGVMIVLLLRGYGLIHLACAYLLAQLVSDLLNFLACRRIFPQLRIRTGLATRATVIDLFSFGGKTLLQAAARTGLYQTNGLVVSYFLGPAALAVYSRQRALVAFAMTLMNQYGNVFTPAASSADARGDRKAMRELLFKSSRYGLYISLPMVLGLAISGGPVVRLWMGSAYEAPAVLAVMALGHLASLSHRGVYRILTGMNRHGRGAIAELIAALGSIVIGLVLIGLFNLGILGASIAVAVAVTLGGGVYPAVCACRLLEVGLGEYVRKTLIGPVVANVPFAACLFGASLIFSGRAMLQLIVGFGAGGLCLLPIYWHYVVPIGVKRRWSARFAGSDSPRRAVDAAKPAGASGGNQDELVGAGSER